MSEQVENTESNGTNVAGTATAQNQDSGERQGGKMFSQAELDEIVKKEKSKAASAAERRLRKELEASTGDAKDAKSEAGSNGDSTLRDELAKLKNDLQFERAVKKIGFVPNEDQEDLLRTMFETGGAERMAKLAAQLKPAEAQGSDKKEDKSMSGNGYKSPGAPSGAPSVIYENNPIQWNSDDINRLRRDGSFRDQIQKWRDSLPGGGTGLFQKRIKK